jgi:hypothetical protein
MEVCKERASGLVRIRDGLGEDDHRLKLGGRKRSDDAVRRVRFQVRFMIER